MMKEDPVSATTSDDPNDEATHNLAEHHQTEGMIHPILQVHDDGVHTEEQPMMDDGTFIDPCNTDCSSTERRTLEETSPEPGVVVRMADVDSAMENALGSSLSPPRATDLRQHGITTTDLMKEVFLNPSSVMAKTTDTDRSKVQLQRFVAPPSKVNAAVKGIGRKHDKIHTLKPTSIVTRPYSVPTAWQQHGLHRTAYEQKMKQEIITRGISPYLTATEALTLRDLHRTGDEKKTEQEIPTQGCVYEAILEHCDASPFTPRKGLGKNRVVHCPSFSSQEADAEVQDEENAKLSVDDESLLGTSIETPQSPVHQATHGSIRAMHHNDLAEGVPHVSIRAMPQNDHAQATPHVSIRPMPRNNIAQTTPHVSIRAMPRANLAQASPHESIRAMPRYDLAQATPVTQGSRLNLQVAEPVEGDGKSQEVHQRSFIKRLRITYYLLGGFVFMIVIVISLGVALSMNQSDEPTASPSISPTFTPSSALSSSRFVYLDHLYDSLPDKTQTRLQSHATPQWKAFNWLSNHQSVTQLPEWRKTQLFVLATFYFSFEGAFWPDFRQANWLNDSVDECLWFFSNFTVGDNYFSPDGLDLIEPCTDNSRVQNILLHSLELTSLSPSLPPEIALLTSLSTIALPFNNITVEFSEMFSTELYRMVNLTRLNILSNSLSGRVPSELGFMTGLTNLLIAGNRLSGPLPSELGGMTKLMILWFGHNDITGQLPTEVGLMTSLSLLESWSSSLSGTLPSQIGLLKNLKMWNFFDNSIHGLLPPDMFKLTRLEWLHIGFNLFSGTICTDFGLLTSLVELTLSGNSFSGRIPSELGLMKNLSWLDLSSLPMLSGPIPTEIFQLTSMKYIDLRGNSSLSGTMPNEWCYLQNSSCTFLDYGVYLYPCTLAFECSDRLCGCNCPCPNGTGSNAVFGNESNSSLLQFG